MSQEHPHPVLERHLGVVHATLLGLGSIIGTGVFVSIGLAAGVAGAAVLAAIAVAAGVATCNALSSAQLAASHPVSGGTYEYGYRYLRPWLGFAAGWMFLCAKSASAATAALGFAGYLLAAVGYPATWIVPVALATVALVTGVVLVGIRLSSRVNMVIVAVTLLALVAFMVAGAAQVSTAHLEMEFGPASFLHAAALMFVAFTGYGRIATLGEEVVDPRRTIPRAIIATLVISTIVYMGVATVAVGAVGAQRLEAATTGGGAPLEVVAQGFTLPVEGLVAVGAMTAMLGVLLNLVLGLSRVMLAMGRRGDMPRATARVSVAVVVVGLAIALLASTGSFSTTWSFSAFTVLIYYGVTNLAALQLPRDERLFSPIWAVLGLIACLALAFAVEPRVWVAGLIVLGGGLVWHLLRRRISSAAPTTTP